jgi:ADP-ribosyl-[dinitrogen reductase] hydrolase
MQTIEQKYIGSLIGLAIGDALGTTVEFLPRGTFAPINTLVGGGPFNLKLGQWTDDTSMALCLAESLIECNGFDANDQMTRYLKWWKDGYLSSTGKCFDIGKTTKDALSRFEESGNPYSGSEDPRMAGNGSLMRLAPVALYFYPSIEDVIHYAGESSRTTHAAPAAIECCQLLASVLVKAISGEEKSVVLNSSTLTFTKPKVKALAEGQYKTKTISQIQGSGYSVASLEAALWCFYNSTSFREAVLMAANLGDDSDTTAAITGQVAGAFYGIDNIPIHWQNLLYKGKEIKDIALKLLH